MADNTITLYHGTSEENFAPRYGGGRDYHDYGNGFYTTEDIEAAKEWACQGEQCSAFVYKYELNMQGLSVLNLDENNVLAWVSVLMTHRRGRKIRGAARERCERMIGLFGVDVSQYDVVRGFRANDSYFQFTADFVTDTISLDTLKKSISAGNLGCQVCIKSEKAYRQLGECVDLLKISDAQFAVCHERYVVKDAEARALANAYADERQTGQLLSDILRERGAP
jgi:hypothetical protein